MTESEIQKNIMKVLEACGIFHWRNNSGARGGVRYGCPGSPDIIAILPGGTFLGIEVKTPSGKQSSIQAAFQHLVEEAGGLYIIARSVNDVLSFLVSLEPQDGKSVINGEFLKFLGVNGDADRF